MSPALDEQGVTVAARPRARLTDRLNPILVKEVRQALRGRYFRVLFWSTLSVATIVALGVVANAASNENLPEVGTTLFMWIIAILAGAVHGFVPFSAFMSTSAEWDENTWDLLVISNLKPRQLVLGKLLSAVIQGVLFYSAFGPLLVFAFLLNGVDLMSIAVILPCSFVTCCALCLFGIALSSLARARFARIVLMAMFAAALVFTTFGTVGLAFGIVQQPENLHSRPVLLAIGTYITAAAVVGAVAFAIACARFAHDEENRSTGLRIMSVGLVLAAIPWAIWFSHTLSSSSTGWACQVIAATIDLPLLLFFLTEREALGRRVSKRVPRNPLLAVLSAPFLPGGGRGVLLFVVQFALALASVPIVLAFTAARVGAVLEGWSVVAIVYGFLWLYFGPLSGIAAFFGTSTRAQAAVRITGLLLVPLSIVAPVFIGMFLGVKHWMEFDHPLNPVMQIDTITSFSSQTSISLPISIVVLVLGGSLGLMLNLPRMLRGLSETLAASRARRSAQRQTLVAPIDTASHATAER